MKYSIITLGNAEREAHRQGIRDAMAGYEEATPKCINGKDPEELREQIEKWGFKIGDSDEYGTNWRPGELGLWYSNINAWNYSYVTNTPLMVFEDDAVPRSNFLSVVEATPLPGDYDFVTYYTPQRTSYQQSFFRLVRTDQEHGNICMLYSPEGSGKILDGLSSDGLHFPVDIWVFKQNKFFDTLRGYGPKVTSFVIIDHDFDVPTNIHEDERIDPDAI